MDWDWGLFEAVAKTVGTLIGVGFAGYKAYTLGVRGFRSRAMLAKDLEILKMLDPTDPNHSILKASIDRFIKELYAPPTPSVWKRLPPPKKVISFFTTLVENIWSRIPKPLRWADFSTGVVMFLGFSVWTAYSNYGTFSGWSLLTAFFALAGFVGIGTSFSERESSLRRATKLA